MKKILRVLLVALLLLSVLGVMAGCGEEPVTDNPSSATEITLPAALAGIAKFNVPELAGTAWELVGGMVDGVEMEAEDVNTVITNFGGSMNFIFNVDNKVMLSNGQNALESTYTVTDKVLAMDFNEYKYRVIFTVIGENTVMIVANPEEPNSALYFTEIVG